MTFQKIVAKLHERKESKIKNDFFQSVFTKMN